MTSRIVIVGGPKCGKTTTAELMCKATPGCEHRCTDSVMQLGWSESSAEVATWFGRPGVWVIEGVATARALRKWLAEAPPDALPCDAILVMEHPVAPREQGQRSMAKGVMTVWRQIELELEIRGVEIKYIKPARQTQEHP